MPGIVLDCATGCPTRIGSTLRPSPCNRCSNACQVRCDDQYLTGLARSYPTEQGQFDGNGPLIMNRQARFWANAPGLTGCSGELLSGIRQRSTVLALDNLGEAGRHFAGPDPRPGTRGVGVGAEQRSRGILQNLVTFGSR